MCAIKTVHSTVLLDNNNSTSLKVSETLVQNITLSGRTKKVKKKCFTACNFRNIGEINTKFGTHQRYFILTINS